MQTAICVQSDGGNVYECQQCGYETRFSLKCVTFAGCEDNQDQ